MNKVFSVNFAVSSIYGNFDKVVALFAREEDAAQFLHDEVKKTTKSLRERGYVKVFNLLSKVKFENPESGEYELYYLQEWEVK